MESVGTYLINGRKARGLTREEISRVTKIPLRFITALEEDDFTNLPEDVYVRGFIRSYCQEIDQSPDPLLTSLKQRRPAAPVIAPDEGRVIDIVENETRVGRAHSKMGLALVLLFFVLGLLFGIISLTQAPGLRDMSQVTNPAHIDYPSTIKPRYACLPNGVVLSTAKGMYNLPQLFIFERLRHTDLIANTLCKAIYVRRT